MMRNIPKSLVPVLVLVLVMLVAGCAAKKPKAKVESPAFVAEKSFRRANELIQGKHYQEARRELELVKGRDREKKFAPLAHLRVADTYLLEKEPEPAVEEFRKFLNLYPKHKYASYAQYQIGMVYFDQIEDHERGQDAAKRALQEFAILNQRYPRHPYRESVEHLSQVALDTIADHHFMVGDFYFKKKSYSSAINRMLDLMKEFPSYSREDEVLYRICMSYIKLGKLDEAEPYLNRLTTKYTDTKIAAKAKKAFQKAKAKKG